MRVFYPHVEDLAVPELQATRVSEPYHIQQEYSGLFEDVRLEPEIVRTSHVEDLAVPELQSTRVSEPSHIQREDAGLVVDVRLEPGMVAELHDHSSQSERAAAVRWRGVSDEQVGTVRISSGSSRCAMSDPSMAAALDRLSISGRRSVLFPVGHLDVECFRGFRSDGAVQRGRSAAICCEDVHICSRGVGEEVLEDLCVVLCGSQLINRMPCHRAFILQVAVNVFSYH
ncbi:hypothetical protein MPTK2_3g21920 [Marchantia polymorpha subsp. ruderalis]